MRAIMNALMLTLTTLSVQAQNPPTPDTKGPPQPPGTGNAWVLKHFEGVHIETGNTGGVTTVIYPVIVKDAYCRGGYYCYAVADRDYWQEPPLPASPDQRVAFVNVTARDQIIDGFYGASIITYGAHDWNQHLNTFMSHVVLEPNWPRWISYGDTNMDGFTGDGGGQGGLYLEDVTVRNWNAEAALDIKQKVFQAVRLKTEGSSGLNTLKIWQGGPHYIVDSEINND